MGAASQPKTPESMPTDRVQHTPIRAPEWQIYGLCAGCRDFGIRDRLTHSRSQIASKIGRGGHVSTTDKIETYFSHSWRSEDVDLNLLVWDALHEKCALSVDRQG